MTHTNITSGLDFQYLALLIPVTDFVKILTWLGFEPRYSRGQCTRDLEHGCRHISDVRGYGLNGRGLIRDACEAIVGPFISIYK